MQGQADALVIDTALRKYLEGAPLNAAEMAVVSAAIGAVGAPPNAPYAIAEATVPAAPAPKPSGGGSGGSTPARRKPLTGWDLVRDNLDAVFVVQWSSETRYRVQPRDLDRAREIFGSPLTRASQIPGDARNAQRGLLEQIEREEGDRLPSGRIYLDARMGWREAGTWAPTIGTTR